MNDEEYWVKYFHDLVLIHAPHTGTFCGNFLKNEIEFNEIQSKKYTDHAWQSYDALRAAGYMTKEGITCDRLTSLGVQESLRLINPITPRITNNNPNSPKTQSVAVRLLKLMDIAVGMIAIYEFIIKKFI